MSSTEAPSVAQSVDRGAVAPTDEHATSGHLLDRAGICVSALCLVQCLALSLAIVLAPMMSLGPLGSDTFHRVLLALIVPLSFGAFWSGYRDHRHGVVLALGAVGVALVLAAAVLEATVLSPLAASGVTSLGGCALIVAHGWNLRLRRAWRSRPRNPGHA